MLNPPGIKIDIERGLGLGGKIGWKGRKGFKYEFGLSLGMFLGMFLGRLSANVVGSNCNCKL